MSSLSAIVKLYEKSELTKAEVAAADRLLTKLKGEIRGKQPISHVEVTEHLLTDESFDRKLVRRYLESAEFDEAALTDTINKLASTSPTPTNSTAKLRKLALLFARNNYSRPLELMFENISATQRRNCFTVVSQHYRLFTHLLENRMVSVFRFTSDCASQYFGDDRFTREGKSLAELLFDLTDDEYHQLPSMTRNRLITLFSSLGLAARTKQIRKLNPSILDTALVGKQRLVCTLFTPMLPDDDLIELPRDLFTQEVLRRASKISSSNTDRWNRLIDLLLKSPLEPAEIRVAVGWLMKRRGTIKARLPETVVRLAADEQWPLLDKLRSAFRMSLARITETVNRSKDADAVERYNKYLFENFRPMMRVVL